jgi:hypothetical protein
MDINGININIKQTGSSLSSAGNVNTAGAQQSRQSALADAASSGSGQTTQQLNSLTNANFIKDQIETIMFSFPPFFPAGSPQRLDLITGVREVQYEIKNSSLPTEVKDKLAGQELTAASTDKEISNALKGVQQYTEGYSSTPSQSTESSQTVNIVSLEI